MFGLLSLMVRDVVRLDMVALEDTLCYTIPAEEVQELMERHREVSEYFVRTSITRYMDRSLTELHCQTKLSDESHHDRPWQSYSDSWKADY